MIKVVTLHGNPSFKDAMQFYMGSLAYMLAKQMGWDDAREALRQTGEDLGATGEVREAIDEMTSDEAWAHLKITALMAASEVKA